VSEAGVSIDPSVDARKGRFSTASTATREHLIAPAKAEVFPPGNPLGCCIVWSLRRASVLVAVLAAAVLMAACGAGDRNVGPTASVSQTQAQAFAREVNLRPSDLPGFVAGRARRERAAAPGPLGLSVERCDDGVVSAIRVPSPRLSHSSAHRVEASLPATARVEASPATAPVEAFALPIQSVRSVVYVMANPTSASHELAVLSSSRARRCAEEALRTPIGGSGNETAGSHKRVLRKPSLEALSVGLRGLPMFGLRTRSCLQVLERGCRSAGFIEDHIGVVVGPALITLDVAGDPDPFPSAIERRLLLLLYHRAETHKLV